MKITSILLILTLFSPLRIIAQTTEKPLNIIFIIGDGMGLSQVSSLYVDNTSTNFNRFKFTGLVRTSSATHKITDSAAGATAYSTGEKTYNGAIGVDTDTIAIPTIFEQLKEKGYNTGMVVTVSITHATPASYYAHVESRTLQEEIALHLINSEVDFFAGGGLNFFTKRKDSLNLLDSLKSKGFTVIDQESKIPAKLKPKKSYGFLLAADEMPPSPQRGNFLPDFTQKSLDYFAQKKEPYILLIEGSQIDWAGHKNDGQYLLEEMKDFDRTLGKVLDFYEMHPNTLVLVTADHETGGFGLSSVEGDYDKIQYDFTTGGHTSALVPLFAIGPGAENFTGIMENIEVYKKLMELLK